MYLHRTDDTKTSFINEFRFEFDRIFLQKNFQIESFFLCKYIPCGSCRMIFGDGSETMHDE